MKYAPIISAFIAFLIVWFLTPWLIRYLRKINLVVKDMNKEHTPLVPISGGLAVLGGLLAGLMSFIFLRTFFPNTTGFILDEKTLLLLLAACTSILIISFVGFIDDLVIKKVSESSSGLRQWQKPLLTLSAAVPLMAVNAGTKVMRYPILGHIDVGILYALILIPIGVVGAANMINMLAGFNGLEAGLGIICTGMLGLYAYLHQSYIGALIALIAFVSLLAFYRYNRFPAKILPGDSLTYLLGAVIATIAIIGNLEKAALIISIPFFIEFFLKLRSKFKAQSYGYYKDGKINSRYTKIYSITHIFTRTGRYTEKQVVAFILLIQLGCASLIWFI